MLTTVHAGPYTVQGMSVGGIYTALRVRELDVVLDAGAAPRSFAGASALFLSHGHADHVGALTALLGIRMLCCQNRHLKIHLPAPIESEVADALAVFGRLQRKPANVTLVPLEHGDEVALGGDLRARAFRTFHPVPSLGYLFFRRVQKLRPELAGLDGLEIRRRRQAGEVVTDDVDHLELAYVTDTLPRVLETEPDLFRARTLILECTFLDDRHTLDYAHARAHIHLDDILAHADRFANESLLLMHFSQTYRPAEIPSILERKCPTTLASRIIPLLPPDNHWPG